LENQTSPASPDDQNTNDPQQTDPRHLTPLEYMASNKIAVGADLSALLAFSDISLNLLKFIYSKPN